MIWHHSSEVADRPLTDVHARVCPHCRCPTVSHVVPDLWPQPTAHYIDLHNRSIADWASTDPDVWTHEEHWRVVDDELHDVYVDARVCGICGWWKLLKNVAVITRRQVWDLTFTSNCVLRTLDLSDLTLPIATVRQYLAVRYDARHHINPTLFERVVGDVFRSMRYEVVVTGRTGDGGIDVVLESSTGDRVGVQVKRHRHGIEVEQIRAFVGALVLGGFTRGVYVTTSRYSRGAKGAVMAAARRGIAIELIDANGFFRELGIAQRADAAGDIVPYPLLNGNRPELNFALHVHRNSY